VAGCPSTFRPRHAWLASSCRAATATVAAIRCAQICPAKQFKCLIILPFLLTAELHNTLLFVHCKLPPRCNILQWLTRVKISTSGNNVDWIEQGAFAGSSDQDSLTNIIFSNPAVCRYVRLQVVSVSGHASARWDVLKSADQSSLALDRPEFLRANPSINQYAFSSCYSNDAPGSGHCRPQIDSVQVSCC